MSNLDVAAQLRAVQEKGQVFNPNDSTSRKALYLAAQELAESLETPLEKAAKLSFYDPTIAYVLRLCIEMKLFEKMAESNSPMTTAELAAQTNSDPKLLERFLKHLATSKCVTETEQDTYAANSLTHTLADAGPTGMFTNVYDLLSATNSKAIDYFRQLGGFKNPSDKNNTLFKYAFNTDLHYFDWVYQPANREQAEAFRNHMRMKTMGPKWFETVPVEEILGRANEDEVLLVDVGGAAGHDLQAFHAAYPSMSGRLVLQDKHASIDALDASALAPIEPIGYDFFTPQPIKGARGYYLKMVLHDWPDDQCQQILENLKPALTPGTSKILINEIVIPDTKAGWFETSVDMLMMICHGAHERREKEWKALVERAGLKVTKKWQCGDAVEKLIVVELP